MFNKTLEFALAGTMSALLLLGIEAHRPSNAAQVSPSPIRSRRTPISGQRLYLEQG